MKFLFIEIPNFWTWADNFGAFKVFSANLSAPILVHTVSPLSNVFINQRLFLQKTMPLYPSPKYLVGIWDLAIVCP
jgi:hypothetical protein